MSNYQLQRPNSTNIVAQQLQCCGKLVPIGNARSVRRAVERHRCK
jgi:hypothetical protein